MELINWIDKCPVYGPFMNFDEVLSHLYDDSYDFVLFLNVYSNDI